MDRHRLDFVSLLFGLTFTVLGVAIASGGLRLEDTGFDSAIPLGIGFVGLVLAAFTLNWYFRTHGEATDATPAPRTTVSDPKADPAEASEPATEENDTF